MKDFFYNVLEKVKKEYYATLKNFGIKHKEKVQVITEQSKNYEVSLVPSVKRQMIKAMKFRNVFLFVCIVLGAVAAGAVAVLGSVWEGQNITMSDQDSRIEKMSKQIRGDSSLADYLTIQNQLENIADINANRKILSRVFSVMSAVLPEKPDMISISELSVDLPTDTIKMEAQADAKVSPFIDYRVLESFKKSVSLMKYDYGRYVDSNDNEIPTRCMVETDANGNTLIEEDTQGVLKDEYVYAYWMKGRKGCDPSRDDVITEDEESVSVTRENTANERVEVTMEGVDSNDAYAQKLAEQQKEEGVTEVEVVKIYRTPRFSTWYRDGNMSKDGVITDVPHFDSKCISYSADSVGNGLKWTSQNECMLLPEGEGLTVQDSSNGRDSDDTLVLRFTAFLTLNPEVLKFDNKHVMAISPTGQNVTDSYRQIQGMFAERAADCSDTDVVCTSTATSNTTTEEEE